MRPQKADRTGGFITSVKKAMVSSSFELFFIIKDSPKYRKRKRLPASESPSKNGAGEGNRTLVTSLEGWRSTIELHPHVVGAAGFEPATPWSRTKCATKLRYAPAT